MQKRVTNELMRIIGGQLKMEVRVQPKIPLEIKLRVERLWLAELIRGSFVDSLRPSLCSESGDAFRYAATC